MSIANGFPSSTTTRMYRASREAAGAALERNPQAHAFLIRRHGLYTWGQTLAEAERHVEILEFLFETIGRTASFNARSEEAYPWRC